MVRAPPERRAIDMVSRIGTSFHHIFVNFGDRV
jgi:hypothetical protein